MVMHLEESLHTLMIRLPAQRAQALQSYIVHRTRLIRGVKIRGTEVE